MFAVRLRGSWAHTYQIEELPLHREWVQALLLERPESNSFIVETTTMGTDTWPSSVLRFLCGLFGFCCSAFFFFFSFDTLCFV